MDQPESSAPPSAKQQLLYAAIARGSTVLVDATPPGITGNFSLIALKVFEKHPLSTLRGTYSQDRNAYHVLSDPASGLVFLTLSESGSNIRVPFGFLEDVKQKFTAKFSPESTQSATAYALQTEFGPTLQQRLSFFSKAQADTISRVQGNLNEVREIMVQNIEKVLERGEKIELLVDRTDRLAEESNLFRRQAVRVRREMEWQRTKYYATIGLGVSGLLYLLLGSICGFSLNKC